MFSCILCIFSFSYASDNSTILQNENWNDNLYGEVLQTENSWSNIRKRAGPWLKATRKMLPMKLCRKRVKNKTANSSQCATHTSIFMHVLVDLQWWRRFPCAEGCCLHMSLARLGPWPDRGQHTGVHHPLSNRTGWTLACETRKKCGEKEVEYKAAGDQWRRRWSRWKWERARRPMWRLDWANNGHKMKGTFVWSTWRTFLRISDRS